jgi:HTH-type transcriptional regulator, sugar sensing transcriptional regulator
MEDLLANLQKLGFSQYESRAYVSLLQNPEVTAYELARHSGIPPSKIYEVVERLLAKELVTTLGLGGHPKYVALEPGHAVERYRRSYDLVLDTLATQLENLYAGEKGSDAYVWNLVDREDIETKAVQLIKSAQSEVLVAVWASELSALEPHLAEADGRGVAVALCLYGDADPGFGVVYNHVTDPVVLRDQGARRMVLVADRGEALIGYYPEVGEVTAVWSANRGFVQMAYDYIRHDIWVVKLVRRFEIPINEAYGATRERMRDIFHPEIPEVRVVRPVGADARRQPPTT